MFPPSIYENEKINESNFNTNSNDSSPIDYFENQNFEKQNFHIPSFFDLVHSPPRYMKLKEKNFLFLTNKGNKEIKNRNKDSYFYMKNFHKKKNYYFQIWYTIK